MRTPPAPLGARPATDNDTAIEAIGLNLQSRAEVECRLDDCCRVHTGVSGDCLRQERFYVPTGAAQAPREFMPCPVTSVTPLAHAESEADEASVHAESEADESGATQADRVAPDPALRADAAAEHIPSTTSNGIIHVAIHAESEVARGLSLPITGLRRCCGEAADSDSDTILPSASSSICGTAADRSKSERRSRQNSTTYRRGVGLGHPSRGRHQRCDWHREFCRLSGRCGRLRIHSSSGVAASIVRGECLDP